MSPPDQPSGRYYLFDTGPLLAFAAANGGPTVLKDRYAGRAGIIGDVDRELRGLTRSNDQRLASAAQTAAWRYGWLDRHVIDDGPGLRTVQQLQIRLQTFKRPERRIPSTAIDRQDCGALEARLTGPFAPPQRTSSAARPGQATLADLLAAAGPHPAAVEAIGMAAAPRTPQKPDSRSRERF